MKALINRYFDYSFKEIYAPNWCDDMKEMPKTGSIQLPEGIKIMMAGNLGQGLGVDVVISLIESLSDLKNLHFVLVGGGSLEGYMREKLKSLGLYNVTMTGQLPFSEMPALYNQADAMLLTLKPTDVPSLRSTVPSRLQSYMSAGKPILGMVDGSARDVIEAADCGFCVAAGDVKGMSHFIRDYLMLHLDDFKKKGDNSRMYYEKFYQKDGCINNLEYYLIDDYSRPLPYNVPKV
jgi:glycosyltransferase involved in cell wall biosynthesis